MFRFSHPEILYLLLIVPVFILFFVLMKKKKNEAITEFGDWALLKPLMPLYSPFRENVKFIMLLLVVFFLVIAAAGPQFGSRLQQVKAEGVEMEILLDVSNSMLSEDIKPNRLERSKLAISRIVDKLGNDKMGLIVFAGDAYVQIPMTTDYSAAKMFLSEINTKIVPVQGTAIGRALEMATKSFSENEKVSKVIIIITDGENHQDNAIEAAKKAKAQGIVIHTIGMGSEQGAPIPDGSGGYRKDASGKTVVSKLDEQTLKKIAGIGEGMYIRASNANIGLNTIVREIERMEKGEIEENVYTDYDDKFHYFLWIALLLSFVELFYLARRNKYFMKINIFKHRER